MKFHEFKSNMNKSLTDVDLDENVIDKVKEIASKKSAKKIDGVMVDSFTASAISQIYDKVNDANKKKMDKLPITKLANLAFKMMQKNEFVPEEVDLDEGYLELTFKSKQDAEKAYNKINNEIFAAGSVPYDDMNQEGNEIQFDLDGNLNRRNQILKDLKSGGIKNFKVTANEELKEGKMSQLHQLIKDKKSAEEIAKIMKLDVKTVKTLMASHYREDVEEGAAADARRGMSKDPDFSRKDSADVDDDATDDDVKGASKNIIMQMRKAVSLRGKFDVVFGDGKKIKVPEKVAQVVQQKYNSLRKTSDKEKFQAQVAKSYKDMLKVLKAGYSEQKESILDRIDRKIKENKNG